MKQTVLRRAIALEEKEKERERERELGDLLISRDLQ
jgi:hypothetical protein